MSPAMIRWETRTAHILQGLRPRITPPPSSPPSITTSLRLPLQISVRQKSSESAPGDSRSNCRIAACFSSSLSTASRPSEPAPLSCFSPRFSPKSSLLATLTNSTISRES
ncbi:hypothetical protein OH77DRAFT_331066 [Trametes cingulata]|nr:hypothetical protein OH77DRAFT_331066 [Trametes cingulata]